MSVNPRFHLFSDLPYELQAQVFSFSDRKEQPIGKSVSAALASSRLTWDDHELRSFAPNTFIGKLVQRQPLIDSEAGRIERIKRVNERAISQISDGKEKLRAEDWAELGRDSNSRIADLTYPQMNLAGERIASNPEDEIFMAAFERIFLIHNEVEQSIAIPPDALLRNQATWIREWLKIPANERLILGVGAVQLHEEWDEVLQIDTANLERIPEELLQFPNLAIDPLTLGKTLEHAVKEGNLEFARKIIQSNRAIDPMKLGWALYFAAQAGRVDIVQPFLQSNREIDPESLGWALCNAAEAGATDVVRVILENNRGIDPERLHGSLRDAANAGKADVVKEILGSNREIDPERLHGSLRDAANAGKADVVKEILGSNRELDPQGLALALRDAANAGKADVVKEILGSNRELDPQGLALALRDAANAGKADVVKEILGSNRELDPQGLAWALYEAGVAGKADVFRAILDSNRKIDPFILGMTLHETITKEKYKFAYVILFSKHSFVPHLSADKAAEQGEFRLAKKILSRTAHCDKIQCGLFAASGGVVGVARRLANRVAIR